VINRRRDTDKTARRTRAISEPQLSLGFTRYDSEAKTLRANVELLPVVTVLEGLVPAKYRKAADGKAGSHGVGGALSVNSPPPGHRNNLLM
jgi:hypothetical protein